MGRMRVGRSIFAGATSAELMATISVVVVATVGGAYAFVPSFRDGATCLGDRVGGMLGADRTGAGCAGTSAGGSNGATTPGEPGGGGTGGGTLPPLSNDETPPSEEDAGSTRTCLGSDLCTTTENMHQAGSGAEDGCWATAIAQVLGVDADQVQEKCNSYVETQTKTTMVYAIVRSVTEEIPTLYMSQDSVVACLKEQFGVDASLVTPEECKAPSGTIGLFEWDSETDRVVVDGDMGHFMACEFLPDGSVRVWDAKTQSYRTIPPEKAKISMGDHGGKVVCVAPANGV